MSFTEEQKQEILKLIEDNISINIEKEEESFYDSDFKTIRLIVTTKILNKIVNQSDCYLSMKDD